MIGKLATAYIKANVAIGIFGFGVFAGLCGAAALIVAFAVGINLVGLVT